MVVVFLILALAFAIAAAGAGHVPGVVLPAAADWLAVALAVVGLALAVRLLWHRRRRAWVVVDGSNVLHWAGAGPNLNTLRAVLGELTARGLVPVVWFDANAGYLVAGRWLGPREFARALGLPTRQIFVAPKGTPADPLLLDGARALGARVVTNDRYRDWIDGRPWLTAPGFLVRGDLVRGRVTLALGDGARRAA